MRRLGTWLLGSAVLSLGSAGCYQQHTADEEAIELEFPEGSYDAGVVAVVDAGSANNCGAPGTIQAFLCGLQGGQSGAPGQPSLTDLLGPGGLGDLLGGMQPGARPGTQAAPRDAGVVGAGGVSIEDILGVLGGGTEDGRQPSIEEILAGFGFRDAGMRPSDPPAPPRNGRDRDAAAPRPGIPMPSPEDCVEPADPLTALICAMQARRDAGVPRPPVVPVELDAGAPPATLVDASAPTSEVDAAALPVDPTLDAGTAPDAAAPVVVLPPPVVVAPPAVPPVVVAPVVPPVVVTPPVAPVVDDAGVPTDAAVVLAI
jgi:hypothetical protein